MAQSSTRRALAGAVAGRRATRSTSLTLGVEGPDVADGRALAVPDPGRRRRSPRRGGCCSTRSTCTTRGRAGPSTRCSTSCRPDVVHTNVVQGLSSVALTRPVRHGIAHVHTLHDYWLLCQRNSMVHRDGRRRATRGAGRASASRGSATRRCAGRPPGVVLAVSQAIAREHEQLALGRGPAAGALQPGRDRRRSERSTPRGDGHAADVRVPRPARRRQGRAHACSTRSPRRRWPTAGSSSRAAVRSRPRCRPPGRRSSPRAGSTQDAQGGAARRPRLPRGPVAVEGPGAGRGQRGPRAGDPGDRRRRSAASRS